MSRPPDPPALPTIARRDPNDPPAQLVQFTVDDATGKPQAEIRIGEAGSAAPLRPDLSLSYSGAANGAFGLGWQLAGGHVARRDDRQLPRYRDDGPDPDEFTASGFGELVPALIQTAGGWQPDRTVTTGVEIRRYRPRVESSFARLECHRDLSNGDIHWELTTRENITHVFGRSAAARIADPADPRRVYRWLIEEQADAHGNLVAYTYAREDLLGVPAGSLPEAGRLASPAAEANVHLKRVQWGNRHPGSPGDWLFELVVDYGDHDPVHPDPQPDRPWTLRTDAHSSFRAGFDVRSRRLCRRLLMFSTYAQPGQTPVLLGAHEFTYRERPAGSQLVTVTYRGYRDAAGEDPQTMTLPPVEFDYTQTGPPGSPVDVADTGHAGGNPGSLAAGYQWLALEGDGLSGMLSYDGRALRYKRNLGEGRLGSPVALAQRPSITDRRTAPPTLQSPFGDARPALLAFEDTAAYQQRNPAGDWTPLTPFQGAPVGMGGPLARQIDLDGDGRADLLLATPSGARWHRFLGADGWEAPTDSDLQPDALGALTDRTGTVMLADMTGDGLTDLVRVGPGSVTYWPNLGHGRFGTAVRMANAPGLEDGDGFDPRRVRLADIDGSGCADLLYLGRLGGAYYPNLSGNGFGEGQEIAGLPAVSDLDNVGVIDFLGTGTGCLVWTSARPAQTQRPIRYLPLTGGVPPNLLTLVRNNRGGEIQISYRSSTSYLVEDRENAREWAGTLPSAEQLVADVVRYDRVTGGGEHSTYRYRHGLWDPVAREARGFAHVERTDQPLPPPDPGGHEVLPPALLTRTWYHPGAFLDLERLEQAMRAEQWNGGAPPNAWSDRLEDPSRLAAPRELRRALAGRMLRQELYGLDGSPQAAHPYHVTTCALTARALQPARLDTPPAVFPYEHDRAEAVYERDPADPRVTQQLQLQVDPLGNPLRSAEIAYARSSPVEAPQAQTLITVNERQVANVTNAPDWYRIGAGVAEQVSELLAAPAPAGQLYEPDELNSILGRGDLVTLDPADPEPAANSPPAVRLLTARQTLYWLADRSGPAPLGQIAAHGLIHHARDAALSPQQATSVFANKVLDTDLIAAGYGLDQALWWRPGLTVTYDQTLADRPITTTDALGGSSSVSYDPDALLAATVTDAAGNTTTAEYDPVALTAATVTDANGTVEHTSYDALAMVTQIALSGPHSEGDTVTDPTSRYSRDLLAWPTSQAPISLRADLRASAGNPNTLWESTVTHLDGFGAIAQVKRLAEPGVAATRAADGALVRDNAGRPLLSEQPARWVSAQRRVPATDGQQLRGYDPYAAADPSFDPEIDVHDLAPCTRATRDALGRAIQADYPDGTLTRVIVHAWGAEDWDRNDTVLTSAWYAAHTAGNPQDQADAANAAAHANTPTRTALDPAGRQIAQVLDNGAAGQYTTSVVRDGLGRPRSVIDPRGVLAHQETHDLLGQTVLARSADAGGSLELRDALGNPVLSWGARGQMHRIVNDALGRLVRRYVRDTADSPWSLTELIVWGEHADPALAQADYLRGRVYLHFDSAGLQAVRSYDYLGRQQQVDRQFAADYRAAPDWTSLDGLATDALEPQAKGLLEPETFTTSYTHDVLGRQVRRTDPDGGAQITAYGVRGLPAQITTQRPGNALPQDVLASMTFDASGRPINAAFANGTTETRAWDPASGRLTASTTLPPKGPPLRDISYRHDPVGNPTGANDAAQQTRFFANAVVSPDMSFTYDATYRLVAASGREAATPPAAPNGTNDVSVWSLPHVNDLSAVRRYTEQFAYDEAGNLTNVVHTAPGGGSWNSDNTIEAQSNRILTGGGLSYDSSGNLTSLDINRILHWDPDERLVQADLAGGGTAYYQYAADGGRIRKVIERRSGLVEDRRTLDGWDTWERSTPQTGIDQRLTTTHYLLQDERIAMLETRTLPQAATASTATLWRYQHPDPLRSVRLETDTNAALITAEEYRPYGSSAYRSALTSTQPPKRYRFNGQEADEETGLNHHQHRYYAPWLSRWISPDPAGLVDGPNRYWFARDNPIANGDDSGLQSSGSELSFHDEQSHAEKYIGRTSYALDASRAQAADGNGYVDRFVLQASRPGQTPDSPRDYVQRSWAIHSPAGSNLASETSSYLAEIDRVTQPSAPRSTPSSHNTHPATHAPTSGSHDRPRTTAPPPAASTPPATAGALTSPDARHTTPAAVGTVTPASVAALPTATSNASSVTAATPSPTASSPLPQPQSGLARPSPSGYSIAPPPPVSAPDTSLYVSPGVLEAHWAAAARDVMNPNNPEWARWLIGGLMLLASPVVGAEQAYRGILNIPYVLENAPQQFVEHIGRAYLWTQQGEYAEAAAESLEAVSSATQEIGAVGTVATVAVGALDPKAGEPAPPQAGKAGGGGAEGAGTPAGGGPWIRFSRSRAEADAFYTAQELIDRGGPVTAADFGAQLTKFKWKAPFTNRPVDFPRSLRAPELPVRPGGYYEEFYTLLRGQTKAGKLRTVTGKGGEVYITWTHYGEAQTYMPIDPLEPLPTATFFRTR